jgi:hypothetical protein
MRQILSSITRPIVSNYLTTDTVRKKLQGTIEWLNQNKISWRVTGDFDPNVI